MASMVFDKFDRQAVLNAALLKISEEIVVPQERGRLFESLARLIQPVLAFDQAVFSVFGVDRQTAGLSVVGHGALSSLALPVDDEYRQWFNTPRIAEVGDLPSVLKFLQERGIRSYCSAPLNTMHRSLGAIGLGSTHPDIYTQVDVEFLQRVAVQVAFAVGDDLNYRRERNRQAQQNPYFSIEGSPDFATGMLDSDGRVLTWNTSAQRPGGYRSEEIIGKYVSLFYSKPRRRTGCTKPSTGLQDVMALASGQTWYSPHSGTTAKCPVSL
jgi:PAS domain-containing protein